MATKLKRLDTRQLAATSEELYACPSNTSIRIVACTATNDTSNAETFTLHIVPDGSSADATTLVINAKSLGDNESYTCPEVVGHILEDGDAIHGKAGTANQITLHLSGIQIV